MIPLRVTGRPGPAQRTPRGHRMFHTPAPRERRAEREPCDCPVCRSDCAGIVPCMKVPS